MGNSWLEGGQAACSQVDKGRGGGGEGGGTCLGPRTYCPPTTQIIDRQEEALPPSLLRPHGVVATGKGRGGLRHLHQPTPTMYLCRHRHICLPLWPPSLPALPPYPTSTSNMWKLPSLPRSPFLLLLSSFDSFTAPSPSRPCVPSLMLG